MPRRKVIISDSDDSQPMRPALSPEARENQMISLAMDLVEERLRNGTASSQETTHFLKLATTREQLEKEKLEKEILEKEAKIKALEANQHSEALYQEAINAFRSYSGSVVPDEFSNDEGDRY